MRIFTTAAAILLLGTIGQAEEPKQAESLAIEAIDVFTKSKHCTTTTEVLGVVGFFGDPTPGQWLILTRNTVAGDALRELVVARGAVLAERKFRPLVGQDLPNLRIRLQDVKIDSDTAFKLASAVAAKKKVGFHTAHYQLRCRDLHEEPVWMLNLISSKQKSLGVLYFSAETGKLLRETWTDTSVTKIGPSHDDEPVVKTAAR